MLPVVQKLFGDDEVAGDEAIVELLAGGGFRLEWIRSRGDASDAGFWYDQDEAEWVALIAGTAVLEFEEDGMLDLVAGDALEIPAQVKHRVARTSADAVWIALHHGSETD